MDTLRISEIKQREGVVNVLTFTRYANRASHEHVTCREGVFRDPIVALKKGRSLVSEQAQLFSTFECIVVEGANGFPQYHIESGCGDFVATVFVEPLI